jgi:hypothetical protein
VDEKVTLRQAKVTKNFVSYEVQPNPSGLTGTLYAPKSWWTDGQYPETIEAVVSRES